MDLDHAASPGPIVVGVDRSERSRDALALARTLARAAGAPLILVAAYPRDRRSASVEPGAYTEALVEDAQSNLEWAVRPLSGARAELRAVACSSVSRGLQQVAADEDALAIVVGPSHRGPVGRIVPGSVGMRLLRGAPCPIAVAPRGHWSHGHAPIRQIGVGYVGTPEGEEALHAALGLAAGTGAAIRVLGVVEPAVATGAVPLGLGYAEREEKTRSALEDRLRRVLYGVAAPVEIAGDVVDGYADDELARLSDDVDLLVCGSRGLSPLGAVMLGSVSAGVLRKARCPVLVIPRGARDGFAALRPPHTQAVA
jgi:nucleotide-binding universal stress UspA family protein